ncbi:MAG: sulfatase [Myxococcota bacterium]
MEAREVLFDRKPILTLKWRNIEFEVGRFRVPFELPERAVDLSHRDFVVSMLRIPSLEKMKADPRLLDIAWVRRREGWRLLRSARDPRRMTFELEELPGDVDQNVTVRLEGVLPTPPVLESREFELPKRAILELAFGLPPSESVTAVGPVRFEASLLCRGRHELPLLESELDPQDAGDVGWHDRSVVLQPSSRRCRIRLRVGGPGVSETEPVWATPRVLTRGVGEGSDDRNLILISLDTLAADHMSVYRYTRATSPRMDRALRERGVLFREVLTSFPRTDRAHLSLFTSLYTSSFPGDPRFLPPEEEIPMLAESLRDAGFETAAVAEDALVAGSRGFWFGFDRFVERHTDGGDARATFADGLRYVETHARRRFFLFLHTYQVHGPYRISPEYRSLFRDDEMARPPVQRRAIERKTEWDRREGQLSRFDDYDRGVRETDDIVGAFLDRLDELGLARRTVVVLLSDHGEAFGEHWVTGHGLSGHREELNVPLGLWGPGIPAGRTIEEPVSLIDVTPTILDLFGLRPWPHGQGASLLPLIRGEGSLPPRSLFFEWSGGMGVRRGDFKLLRFERRAFERLYDTRKDPFENRPLTGRPRLRDSLRRELERYRAEAATLAAELGTGRVTIPAPLEQDVLKSIRALGYFD